MNSFGAAYLAEDGALYAILRNGGTYLICFRSPRTGSWYPTSMGAYITRQDAVADFSRLIEENGWIQTDTELGEVVAWRKTSGLKR